MHFSVLRRVVYSKKDKIILNTYKEIERIEIWFCVYTFYYVCNDIID